eukprot:g47487.t1
MFNIWSDISEVKITLVKTFEVCDLPVRASKFVARKNWVITGADDMQIRVFNYNTLERVHMFEAHSDYIRCIAVHPTQPYILTSSDDMLIKLWDWEKKWTCTQVFEGHTHYVMQIVINPKDNNQFASASLDRTIKGHEKGVNCIDYYSGGDKPYLISGADDRLVKIWDYQVQINYDINDYSIAKREAFGLIWTVNPETQNKTCVQTLEGHAQNVSCVSFHPELPIIITGSEDGNFIGEASDEVMLFYSTRNLYCLVCYGTVRIWHSSTYRLESTLNYGMERVWCVASLRGSNNVALGYDEGSIIIKQMYRNADAVNQKPKLKLLEKLSRSGSICGKKSELMFRVKPPFLATDAARSAELFQQFLFSYSNVYIQVELRFVVVCGDGEYIIYTAMALRNKSFGSAQEFVWAHDSSEYAIRESNSVVKIFKNFKEKKSFKPDFGAEGIYGGFLLGVRSMNGLAFYDWDTTELIRRIEIQPKHAPEAEYEVLLLQFAGGIIVALEEDQVGGCTGEPLLDMK